MTMRGVEPVERVGDDPQRERRGGSSERRVEQPAQVRARDVLHREEVHAVVHADVEDLTDVRVLQLDDDARFVEKAIDVSRPFARSAATFDDDEAHDRRSPCRTDAVLAINSPFPLARAAEEQCRPDVRGKPGARGTARQ